MSAIIESTSEVEQVPVGRPPVMTKRAFYMRFPTLANGVSTKFTLLGMFQTKEDYAASLVPDAGDRFALQVLIQTGLDLMNFSADVNLSMPYAAQFTGLLLSETIPTAFRLTLAEREAILDIDIADGERP